MEIYAETAMSILDELHTERLAYHSEYLPLAYAINRLESYEDTGLSPEEIERILDSYGRGMTLRTENAQRLEIIKEIPINRLRELAQADREGRLVVLPCLHGKKLLRDGLEFEPDHWNITLTAFAHNQPTRSGKRVGLFSICEAAEAALDAMRGENNA